jgi:hypothetical protein
VDPPTPVTVLGANVRGTALWRVARGRARVGATPAAIRVQPVVPPQPVRAIGPAPAQLMPAKELVPAGAPTLVIVSAGTPMPRDPTD